MMKKGKQLESKGAKVRSSPLRRVVVRLEDVICPDQEMIFANMTGEIEVIGQVSFMSDGPEGKEEFAIIDVPGISMPIIVPKSKVRYFRKVEQMEQSEE